MPRTNPLYRLIGTLICGLLLVVTSHHDVAAQTIVTTNVHSTPSSRVCAKCGQIHGAATTSVAPAHYAGTPLGFATTVYTSPQPSSQLISPPVSAGGTENVLQVLNGQRSRQGLGMLRYDGTLQAVAERRARQMASMGTKSHPPGSFAPGRYEGVGWSSSFSPNGVYACYTSDPNMTAAGAAMARGNDGVYFAVVYR